jgi:hypothetical protein
MSDVTRASVILAEFDSPRTLLAAASKVRDAGYRKFDCHSPFAIHGMDEAMGLKRSPLGFIVGTVAFLALASAVLIVYWISAVDFPMVIAGKPYFSYQAFVPVFFAITVLSSALATLFGMLALNKLPQLHHPLFESERFARVMNDGFFVSVEADDPKFDARRTAEFLKEIGSSHVEVVRT